MNAAPAEPRAVPAPGGAAAVLGLGVPVAALTLLLVNAMHPAVAVAAVGSLLLLALVAIRPYAGALAMTAVYPLMFCPVVLSGTFAGEISRFLLFPMDFLAAPLLAGLALNRLWTRSGALTRTGAGARERRWLYWFAGAFLLWGASRIGEPPEVAFSALGYLRLLAAVGIVAFLAASVDTERRFLLLLRVYCGTAALLAIMAVVATNHAFSVERLLYSAPDLQAWGRLMLYNTPAGFKAALVGLVPGYGLTPKHNLSLYLTAAIVFAYLLFLRARSRGERVLWGALILGYATVNQQAFSRLSLAGLLLSTAGVLFLVRSWRTRIPFALAGLLALYAAGFVCSRPFFPQHVGQRESLASSLTVVASESEYSANSLAGRVHIWADAWRRIQRRLLLGGGPESIGRDPAAGVPTAHNLILSLWGDYGLIGVLLAGGAFATAGGRTYAVLWRNPDAAGSRWQLGAAATATVLSALFVYSFDMPVWSPHLWFMLGLLSAAVRLADHERAQR